MYIKQTTTWSVQTAGVVMAALLLAMTRASAQSGPPPTPSTPLTLAAALREADTHAYANRMAGADVDADDARARLPLKGILPSAHVDAGVMRTTDPIGAFGNTLRQRQATAAAFDPARLNDPAAITNVSSGLVFELPLINADAWTGLRAARRAAESTHATQEWTLTVTRERVVRAYYGAVLAGEAVAVLEQAERAARAALRQTQAMVQQGLVTRADALQADVRVDEVTSQLLTARNDAQSARDQLGLALGRSDGLTVQVPDRIDDVAELRRRAERDTLATQPRSPLAERADMRAATARRASAQLDGLRARGTLLPRVNSFARYDWNAPSALFNGRPNWTVGVVASWSLAAGGSDWADIAGADARARSAEAGEQQLRAQGVVEAGAATRAVAVALARLDLADHSALQSLEAHRLVEKRYAGGLATVAELLGAESTATAAALRRTSAAFALIEAMVAFRRATGADPGSLAELDGAR
jgi:outer membrane protein TolC